MHNLAAAVLDQLWFLNFCDEEELELGASLKQIENLVHRIETEFTPEEREALQEAARRALASWLREPDEHGYTPRTLLTFEQRAFLEQISKGHFSGASSEDDENEDEA